tara:strand:+ start:106 stop:480 length:375 start_codon:yes stop_codon:yes gene_type:complete
MSKPIYLKRNQNNELIALSKTKLEGFVKMNEADMDEVYAFLHTDEDNFPRHEKLLDSDLDMIRVLEDLIKILIDKNIIRFTELPEAAQGKLLSRQQVRSTISDFLSPDSEIPDGDAEYNENVDV